MRIKLVTLTPGNWFGYKWTSYTRFNEFFT